MKLGARRSYYVADTSPAEPDAAPNYRIEQSLLQMIGGEDMRLSTMISMVGGEASTL